MAHSLSQLLVSEVGFIPQGPQNRIALHGAKAAAKVYSVTQTGWVGVAKSGVSIHQGFENIRDGVEKM